VNIANNLENSALYFSENIAVIEGDSNISFAEFNGEATRIASSLVGAGVHPGDHVALCAPNSYEWLAF
jgi:long-chain acyl-CoA synthetase